MLKKLLGIDGNRISASRVVLVHLLLDKSIKIHEVLMSIYSSSE